MSSALKFSAPVQPEGVDQNGDWEVLRTLVGDANGEASWARQKNYVGFSHASQRVMEVQNPGGGGGLRVKAAGGGTVIDTPDTGLTTPLPVTSTLASGTAPFVVASNTLVTNLNADLLDGQHASAFLTQALADLRYLQLTGGTISGNLVVTGTLQVDGNATLGNAATDLVQINGDLDVTNDVTIGDASNGSLLVGTQTLWADPQNNRVGIGTNAPGAAYVLDVNGDANFQDLVTFGDTITANGGVEIDAGGLVVNGSATFQDVAAFNDAVTIDATFKAQNGSGVTRFETGSTGIAFFNSAQQGKQTIVGSRAGNVALKNTLDALANYGLVIDLTTA